MRHLGLGRRRFERRKGVQMLVSLMDVNVLCSRVVSPVGSITVPFHPTIIRVYLAEVCFTPADNSEVKVGARIQRDVWTEFNHETSLVYVFRIFSLKPTT